MRPARGDPGLPTFPRILCGLGQVTAPLAPISLAAKRVVWTAAAVASWSQAAELLLDAAGERKASRLGLGGWGELGLGRRRAGGRRTGPWSPSCSDTGALEGTQHPLGRTPARSHDPAPHKHTLPIGKEVARPGAWATPKRVPLLTPESWREREERQRSREIETETEIERDRGKQTERERHQKREIFGNDTESEREGERARGRRRDTCFHSALFSV